MIIQIIHYLFLAYTIMLIARVIGSWFPALQHNALMRFVVFYTEPYLAIFRRFIPPIGGVLDLSPLIGFIVLKIAEELLISFIYRWS